MTIGLLQVELRFPEPQSLKEKRMLLKSIVVRLRQRFNIAVSEIDGMDLWQKSVLAVTSVAKEKKQVNQIFDHVLDFLRAQRGLEIIHQNMELL